MARDGEQRKHLELGIFRKRIFAAYFDAMNARMSEDDCIREAIDAAAATLLNNRGVELRGLDQGELSRRVWGRLAPSLGALHRVEDKRRGQHLLAVVTRVTTDVAFEFWERHRGSNADNPTDLSLVPS